MKYENSYEENRPRTLCSYVLHSNDGIYMDLSLWEIMRLKVSSLVKPNQKLESTFLNTKPKLTKVVAYDDVLDYNSQARHIFNQINQEK